MAQKTSKSKAAAKKKPAARKKSAHVTKKSSSALQNTDWLVIAWVGLIVVFLAVVVKVYVLG